MFGADHWTISYLARLIHNNLIAVTATSIVHGPEASKDNVKFTVTSSSNSDLATYFFASASHKQPYLASRDAQAKAVLGFFDNLVLAYSDAMRTGWPTLLNPAAFNVSGLAWKDEPYVFIRLGGLSFLGAELAVAALFFGVTMASLKINNENTAVLTTLKDSTIAHLVALGQDGRDAVGGSGGLRRKKEMHDAARRLRVRMEGGRLVLAAKNVEVALGMKKGGGEGVTRRRWWTGGK